MLEKLEQLAALNPVRAGYELTLPEIGLAPDDPDVIEFRRKWLRLGN